MSKPHRVVSYSAETGEVRAHDFTALVQEGAVKALAAASVQSRR
jgi:hypothetical protein